MGTVWDKLKTIGEPKAAATIQKPTDFFTAVADVKKEQLGNEHHIKTPLGLHIVAYTGDITKAIAGGLVLSEGQTLSRTGTVTQLLMQSEPKFKEIRKQMILNHGDMLNPGKVYMSEQVAQFRYVLHAVVPSCHERGDIGVWKQEMAILYQNIFTEAEQRHVSVLALSLLGSGKGNICLEEVIGAAVTSVVSVRPWRLKKVLFVNGESGIISWLSKRCEIECTRIQDLSPNDKPKPLSPEKRQHESNDDLSFKNFSVKSEGSIEALRRQHSFSEISPDKNYPLRRSKSMRSDIPRSKYFTPRLESVTDSDNVSNSSDVDIFSGSSHAIEDPTASDLDVLNLPNLSSASDQQVVNLSDLDTFSVSPQDRNVIKLSASDSGDILRLSHRDIISGNPPDRQETSPHKASYLENEAIDELLPVPHDSQEFSAVEGEFLTCLPKDRPVIEIYRVESPYLWERYCLRKREIEQQNCRTENELRLAWHGTTQKAIMHICNQGFNRSYSGKNAAVYGDGVYFATRSNYSAEDTYSVPDDEGYKYVFQARVLTGRYTKGEKGMRVAPWRDEKRSIMFDSVVDNVDKPNLYVIFHDDQAYPDYLIVFK